MPCNLKVIPIVLSFCMIALIPKSVQAGSKSGAWADSLMHTMNTRQKIGQLFMVSAYSNKNGAHVQEILQLVKDYGIGGLCFFQGSPQKQAELTNLYQQNAAIPMLISMDAEWGVGMRLDSVLLFPKQMALGSVRNTELIYEMGRAVGRQFKALGMHINFAPVVDINNNPENPVINMRSFGEERDLVAERAILYMKGMQDEGILTCAKHFPGHGDTHVDSHEDLPIINYPRRRLDSLELYPFRKIIRAGVDGVMVGHLYVPSVEPEAGIPASLSSKAIQDLLRDDLRFKGIVFSDGLQMKAISKNYPAPVANLKALKAGCDMLVFPMQVPASIDSIEAAILRGEWSMDELDAKCKKILTAKYQMHLNRFTPLASTGILKEINQPQAYALQAKLVEESLMLLKNEDKLVPLSNSELNRTVYLEIGKNQGRTFYKRLRDYAYVPKISIEQHPDSLRAKLDSLRTFETVIIGYHCLSEFPQKRFFVNREFADLLSEVLPDSKKVLVIFGSPYTLSVIPQAQNFQSTLICYNNHRITQDKAAQAIMGGIPVLGIQAAGKSIYSANGKNLQTTQCRLAYVSPEELDIAPAYMAGIDSLVQEALAQKAFPGCQVLAAYKGKVFLNKGYGNISYQDSTKVDEETVYDVASVSKVSGTLGVVMHMFDQHQLKFDDKLGHFIPGLPESKREITLKELLAHQAGLIAFEPYYARFLQSPTEEVPLYAKSKSPEYPVQIGSRWAHKDAVMNPEFFQSVESTEFPYEIGKNFYAKAAVRDSVYTYMDHSKMFPKVYRYSDLSFIYLQRVLEKLSGKGLEQLCDSITFRPLHMDHTLYNPGIKHSTYTIPPTSYDPLFRKQSLQAYVDDNNAAMLRGVAGHAGLFSSCNDLAKYYQMLLWDGTYGKETLLSQKTVRTFTSRAYKHGENRRALGFDKPETDKHKSSPVPSELTSASYGHTGFTGCMVWSDPIRELNYIFLSNRVNPDPSNGTLSKLGTRSAILQLLTKAIDHIEQ